MSETEKNAEIELELCVDSFDQWYADQYTGIEQHPTLKLLAEKAWNQGWIEGMSRSTHKMVQVTKDTAMKSSALVAVSLLEKLVERGHLSEGVAREFIRKLQN